MMKITGLSHLFKWENLHNWWLTKYFFAPLYIMDSYFIVCEQKCTQKLKCSVHIAYNVFLFDE